MAIAALLPSRPSPIPSWDRAPVKVAAVCYRRNEQGEVEFLLVRTAGGRWTFPKGGVDDDPTPAAAAAREAYEEAGVRGKISQRSFTWYRHRKRGCRGARNREVAVEAYLCEVLRTVAPPEFHREPTWFPAVKAKRRLRELRPAKYAAEMERVVDSAVALIVPRCQ